MPEQRLCTQFWQLKQNIKFALTPFINTPHGNLTDAIFDFETSCLEHKTLFSPTFILSPFFSSTSVQSFNLTFSSPSDSATLTRSSAYNSSHGQSVLNSRDRASITIISAGIYLLNVKNRSTRIRCKICSKLTIPACNYMFKVNNRSTRTRCEICSKLTIKRPE